MRILAIRHAQSAYPEDRITPMGILNSHMKRSELGNCDVAFASERRRTQQTLLALGYGKWDVLDNFNELELDDIKAPSAHEYVMRAYEAHPELIESCANLFIEGLLRTRGLNANEVLVVSHNLVLSSVFARLTGGIIRSFDNLSGMNLNIDNGIKLLGEI